MSFTNPPKHLKKILQETREGEGLHACFVAGGEGRALPPLAASPLVPPPAASPPARSGEGEDATAAVARCLPSRRIRRRGGPPLPLPPDLVEGRAVAAVARRLPSRQIQRRGGRRRHPSASCAAAVRAMERERERRRERTRKIERGSIRTTPRLCIGRPTLSAWWLGGSARFGHL